VRDAFADLEKIDKNNIYNGEKQEWAKQRPGIAEDGPLVSELEVRTDKFAQQRPIAFGEGTFQHFLWIL
jgi:hypothetical protein